MKLKLSYNLKQIEELMNINDIDLLIIYLFLGIIAVSLSLIAYLGIDKKNKKR